MKYRDKLYKSFFCICLAICLLLSAYFLGHGNAIKLNDQIIPSEEPVNVVTDDERIIEMIFNLNTKIDTEAYRASQRDQEFIERLNVLIEQYNEMIMKKVEE